jgi:hypothetical protein
MSICPLPYLAPAESKKQKPLPQSAVRGLRLQIKRPSVGVKLCRGDILFEEQVVERAQRAVLLDLEDAHFVAVHRELDIAAPAIELMGADFADISGIAIRTF